MAIVQISGMVVDKRKLRALWLTIRAQQQKHIVIVIVISIVNVLSSISYLYYPTEKRQNLLK